MREQVTYFNPVTNGEIFINSVLEPYINAEPQRPIHEILALMQEYLLVDLLYCDECIKRPVILLRLLRDYLLLKSFLYAIEKETQGTMIERVNWFMDFESEKPCAQKHLATIRLPATTR